jgi:hypothetical protein
VRGRTRPAAGDGGREKRVEICEPLLELLQPHAAVDEEILAELVSAEHLEHEAAEVPELLLPGEEQLPALAAELAGRWQRAANGTCRGGGRSGRRGRRLLVRGAAAKAHRRRL